jgi:pimeloyl-ACP methyl ester carboxylesterase
MALSLSTKRFWLGLVIVWLAAPGCKVFNSTCAPEDRTCLQGGLLRSGQPCIRNGDCAPGLECKQGECTYAGTTTRGNSCVATAECAKGLYCSIDLLCQPITDDAQGEGGACASSADCEQGLVCDVDLHKLFSDGPYGLIPDSCHEQLDDNNTPDQCKLPRECTPRGTQELGQICKNNGECLAGLYCVPNPIDADAEDICVGDIKLPAEPVSTPRWDGAECPEDDDEALAYFEVPRNSAPPKDFYRLPFPNDIRRSGGGIDLKDHPRPPSDLDPPAATRFIEVAGKTDGFATNPVVFFRFSREYDSNSVANNVRIVDITKGSPDYGRVVTVYWGPPERKSRYICPHWLSLHRNVGSPLRPNTTYAAIVSTGLRTKAGDPFQRGPDFEALLKSEQPSGSELVAAWERYAPLREYLEDDDVEQLDAPPLSAAVFTTQDPVALMPKLRAAVEADGPPALSDLTRCSAQTKSPCEDSTGRGACHAVNDDFIEIHGHIALAAFQRGTAPFEEPANGGEIAVDGDGDPELQDHAKVCFALSIPKKAAPEGGYPLLIVGHGTGGSFSSAMDSSGVAHWAARDAKVPSAVLAIDMPSHGSRRGASTRPPEDLFFNFLNPAAARGNAIQGAVDLMSLTLLAQQPIPMGSAVPQPVRIDRSRIVIFGHSQGATHAALMLPFESRARAFVLSGVGGHLASSLRLKEKPVDIGKVLPFAIFDADKEGKLVGGEVNPLLALIQSYFEEADPLNYARLSFREPPSSAKDGHDVFMTYGLYDSFCPERTQQAFADAASFIAVEPDRAMHFNTAPPPLLENVEVGGSMRTVGLRTYDPLDDALDGQEPQDGHFVARATRRGLSDVRRFMDQALQGMTPQIGD